MRLNKNLCVVILSLLVGHTFFACSSNEEKANSNFSNREIPTAALSNSEAEKGVAHILKQYFPKHSDVPDLRYTLNGQYLYEFRDVQTEIKANDDTPDLANGIVWNGQFTLRPSVFKKIDIINCVSTANEDGAALPDSSLDFIGKQVYKDGEKTVEWICLKCKDFVAPERHKVERWLLQCDTQR